MLVIGHDDMQKSLQILSRGKSINGRQIQVAAAVWDDPWLIPHFLVIKETDARKTRRMLDRVRASSTLTVRTTKDFIVSGGMIRLITEEDLIRFEVNADTTRRAGITMSAKLLTLAKRVLGTTAP